MAHAHQGPMPELTLRTTQRQPRACLECTRRKIRCDKKIPCSRCVRLARDCFREQVHIPKATRTHGDELKFLEHLATELDTSRDLSRVMAAIQQRRAHLLSHGVASDEQSQDTGLKSSSGSGERMALPGPLIPGQETLLRDRTTSLSECDSPGIFTGSCQAETPGSEPVVPPSELTRSSPAQVVPTIQTVEFLAWGRHRGDCFPHRGGCNCRSIRPYAEIASINADPDWSGLQRIPLEFPPEVCLTPDQASSLIRLHLDQILWHHNVFHAPTFLAQCEEFWTTGTVPHRLWSALYLSVISVSLWAAANSGFVETDLIVDESVVSRFFRAMLWTLYQENFLENPSLYSIQSIVLSTRVAHNLGLSDLNAALVGAAIRIAHSLGIYQIDQQEQPTEIKTPKNWYAAIETQVGCRCWLQLVIQDHFQIPFTQTYMIHPWHYKTQLPINCNDEDMVGRDDSILTINSYIRTLARIASLIPPLLDGLGPMSDRIPLGEVYEHIISSDYKFRAAVQKIPAFLLRELDESSNLPGWLPVARASLAITAADKIIMIHRPVLFHSFHMLEFARTRATCVSAALTILHQHEKISAQQDTISIWTHSAFCVTAAMVIGLELLYRTNHTDEEAHRLRHTIIKAAARLRGRRCDIIAERGAALIDTVLAAEEDLVIKVMRADIQGTYVGKKAHDIVNQMIENNEIMAKFLALDSSNLGNASTASFINDPSQMGDRRHMGYEVELGVTGAEEIESWFREVFSIDYEIL